MPHPATAPIAIDNTEPGSPRDTHDRLLFRMRHEGRLAELDEGDVVAARPSVISSIFYPSTFDPGVAAEAPRLRACLATTILRAQ